LMRQPQAVVLSPPEVVAKLRGRLQESGRNWGLDDSRN